MFCSNCGAPLALTAGFCTACGTKVSGAVEPVVQQPAVVLDKPATSVPPPLPLKPQAEFPEGVKGWSWGAFFLNWVWAIGNRTWIGLLALIPYVGLIVAIWLGFKGREMAWKNKQWDNLEHFNRVQKKWSRWGVGVMLVCLVLGIMGGIAVPAYKDHMERSQELRSEASLNEMLEQAQTQAQETPSPVAVTSERGTISSNDDTLPESLPTVAGTLARTSDQQGNRFVTLDGRPLFTGEDANWQFPVRSFTLAGNKEAVLMASSGGRGNSCETLFFMLIADASGVQPTPLFGTCAAEGTFEQNGDRITLTLPRMGGNSTIVIDGSTVIEDGEVITMNDDNNPAK